MSSSSASLRSGLTIALGRAARLAARLRGGGSGGTALPGLVMEKTDPGFLRRTLDQLPLGVVVVSFCVPLNLFREDRLSAPMLQGLWGLMEPP